LSAIERGDSHAADELLPLVYDALRNLASQKLSQERPGQTLQPTALVHEVYLRLVDVGQAQHWKSRGHFFAAAAEAMRRILVESARRRKSLKRGGESCRLPLEAEAIAVPELSTDVLALDESLDRLAAHDADAAELVKLRCFSGLSVDQIAEILGVSPRTAARLWIYAKAWLYRDLKGGPRPSE
jgi:RNA polymerase sigma factor (TIGR02999 family)